MIAVQRRLRVFSEVQPPIAATIKSVSLKHSDCRLQRVGRALTVWKSLELLTAIQVEELECGAVAHTCQSQVSKLKHSDCMLMAFREQQI